MSKTRSLRAYINDAEKKELEQIARKLDVPESHIIREGTRREMQRLRKTNPKLKTQKTPEAVN